MSRGRMSSGRTSGGSTSGGRTSGGNTSGGSTSRKTSGRSAIIQKTNKKKMSGGRTIVLLDLMFKNLLDLMFKAQFSSTASAILTIICISTRCN